MILIISSFCMTIFVSSIFFQAPCIKSDGKYKNIKEAISQIKITFCTKNIYYHNVSRATARILSSYVRRNIFTSIYIYIYIYTNLFFLYLRYSLLNLYIYIYIYICENRFTDEKLC